MSKQKPVHPTGKWTLLCAFINGTLAGIARSVADWLIEFLGSR